MAGFEDILRRFYGSATPSDFDNPVLHPSPADVNPWAVEPRPRAELRNPPPRPGDAMAPVAEAISPTLGAYGMGNLLGDTYNKGSEGDWKGVAANLPELAMAAAPMPGRKGNPIRAYHGSPFDFDKFMMEKIGTGEGAQAFGHGLYFAEAEKVADEYRKRLAGANPSAHQKYVVNTPWGGKIEFDSARGNNVPLPEGIAPELAHATKLVYWDGLQKAKGYTSQWLKDAKKGEGVYPDRGVDYYQRLYDYVRQMKTKDVDLRQGRMYEVGLHADPEQFVNLDKSKMDAQPREFQALVRDGLKREGFLGAKDDGPRQMQNALASYKMQHGGMGRSAIDAILSERSGLIGKTAEEVSTNLGDAGIPGLKYKDQWSRGGRGSTHNYVVWNPDIIEILKKYGIAAPAAGLTTADILRQYGDEKEKPDG